MRKIKQAEQKEIGRVKLSDTQELVVTLVDDEKLDLRVWVDSNIYKGWTKQGLRFYLFDDNWTEFRKLIDKVGNVYEEMA
ncbi:hypothetical protein KAT45_03195 [Candidatus Aerophobetes bacterium]|nr:hypothetical protein [Candidatus Aerophobetes bacterium]